MDVEKREPLCTVGGIVICTATREAVWSFLKKLNIDLPYEPAIPALGIYSKEMKTLTQEGICNPMFIAALFTKCQLMDK